MTLSEEELEAEENEFGSLEEDSPGEDVGYPSSMTNSGMVNMGHVTSMPSGNSGMSFHPRGHEVPSGGMHQGMIQPQLLQQQL